MDYMWSLDWDFAITFSDVLYLQDKVINADSAFIFFIIHSISQNDQVGQSDPSGQNNNDSLVWSGKLTRMIWIQNM